MAGFAQTRYRKNSLTKAKLLLCAIFAYEVMQQWRTYVHRFRASCPALLRTALHILHERFKRTTRTNKGIAQCVCRAYIAEYVAEGLCTAVVATEFQSAQTAVYPRNPSAKHGLVNPVQYHLFIRLNDMYVSSAPALYSQRCVPSPVIPLRRFPFRARPCHFSSALPPKPSRV